MDCLSVPCFPFHIDVVRDLLSSSSFSQSASSSFFHPSLCILISILSRFFLADLSPPPPTLPFLMKGPLKDTTKRDKFIFTSKTSQKSGSIQVLHQQKRSFCCVLLQCD